MTKAEMQAEIDRLKDKCDKQALILRQIDLERYPRTFFICGAGGEWREEWPERLHVCPAYGADVTKIYELREPSR